MKITLPDVCICIWHALGFVVFSCVLVAPIVFYDFVFVLHKQTSSSLLQIFLTPPQLILVSNKLKPNPNHLGYILAFPSRVCGWTGVCQCWGKMDSKRKEERQEFDWRVMESREQNSGQCTWSGIDLKKTTTQSKNAFFLFLQNTVELSPSRTIEFCPSLYFAVATMCLRHGKTTV